MLDKIIFWCNSIVALLLLLSYTLPYVLPKSFPSLSVFSLAIPVLIIINLIFCVFWILRLKKQFLLSLIILVLGYKHILLFYNVTGKTKVETVSDVKLLTYNVRLLNNFKWTADDSIKHKIANFVKEEHPNIVCFQEFWLDDESLFAKQYKYSYVFKTTSSRIGQAIFSNYPIVKKGSLNFNSPKTGNNAIYADLKVQDTILRVYNVHLQSLGVDPEHEELNQEASERFIKKVGNSFAEQQLQVETIKNHLTDFGGRYVICGDFNNTAFSYIYKELKNELELQDTFENSGSGFGQTFKLKKFPLRIDFILTDKQFNIKKHSNFTHRFSDHYPVEAVFSLHE